MKYDGIEVNICKNTSGISMLYFFFLAAVLLHLRKHDLCTQGHSNNKSCLDELSPLNKSCIDELSPLNMSCIDK